MDSLEIKATLIFSSVSDAFRKLPNFGAILNCTPQFKIHLPVYFKGQLLDL